MQLIQQELINIRLNSKPNNLVNLRISSSEMQASQERLTEIIDKLIENMMHNREETGRQTSINVAWKVRLFNEVKIRMQQEVAERYSEQQYLTEIRSICTKRRNIWHFWAQPKSVAEFEMLLIATADSHALKL